jgi:phosphate-selective porin OprO/OprP
MNGVPDGGSADADTSDDKDVAGRVLVRPFRRRPAHPLRGLGIGLAGSRGRHEGPSALTPLRTATLEQAYFSYAGAGADGLRTRYSPHAVYHHGQFSGLLEYVESRIAVRTETGRDELAHYAWQAAVSYVLTGEEATDTGGGIQPRGPAGAVQLAARYHRLRVDPRAFTLAAAAPSSSRTAAAWTVGLNWYLTNNLRYTANVERTVFDDNADGPRRAEHAGVFRMQVNF